MREFIKKHKTKLIVLSLVLLALIILAGWSFFKSEKYALWRTPNREQLLASGNLEKYYNDYLNQALKYGQEKNYKQAIIEYNKLLKINPLSEVGWNNLGDIYAETEQYDKAEASYLKLLGIRLEPYVVQKILELYYQKMGDITKARQFFEFVYGKNKNYDMAVIGANFYRGINYFADAYKYYKIASELKPDNQSLKEEMEWAKKKAAAQELKAVPRPASGD